MLATDGNHNTSAPDSTLSVLLIEDNPGDARLVEEHLGESEQTVALRWETSLGAGLTALRDEQPDVVAVDLGLPDSEGAGTVQRCTEEAPTVPLVVLTGDTTLDMAFQALEAGAEEYLRKDELTPGLLARTLRWASERARMKAEIGRQHDWIRSITENVAGGLFRCAPDQGIEYANEALARMFGYDDPEVLLGMDLPDLGGSADARAYLQKFQDGEVTPTDVEVELEGAEGTRFIGLLSGASVTDEQRGLTYQDGVITDITPRKTAERELAETKARYESMVEDVFHGSPTGVLILNDDFEVVWANEAIGTFFGLDAAALRGVKKRWLVQEKIKSAFEAPEQFADRVLQTYDENVSEEEFECHVTAGPEREERWLKHQSRPIQQGRYAGGRVEIYTDITERRTREQELRRLSGAIEQTQEAVLVTEAAPLDEPGPKIIFANAAHREMTGYTEDELIGETPRILQGPKTERDVLDSLRAALEAGESWEGETINYRKDGTPFRIHWNVTPVRDQEGEIEHWVSIQRDVTEEREREAALRRQRNLLEQTQRLAGAWEANVRTGEVSWSDKVYDIHEVPPGEEITTERVINLCAPADRSTLRAAFRRCVEKGEPYDLTIRIITEKGSKRWVRTVAAPVERDDEGVTKVAGAVQDITERKRAEEALRERESRLRGLANTLPGVVFQFFARPDGTFGNHFVSEHAETVLGISSEPEGFYERCLECIPPPHREAFEESVAEAVENEEPWRMEVPFQRPTGETIWLLGLSTPAREGDEVVFNGVILDITNRKKAEQALQDERDRFVTLFSNLPTPVVRGHIDEDGTETITVSDVNTAFEEVFGYATDEIQGKKLCKFILPSDQETAVEINEEVMRRGALQMEVQRRTADGVRDFQLQAATRERSDGPTEIYAMYTDVTDQKRRERELKEAKEEAETAAQLKSAMLANMSHEIRTPLTSIMGFAEVLEDEGAESDVKNFARLISRSGRRLQKTLSSVLELSKLEAGVYELDLEPVGLARIAKETAGMLRPRADEEEVGLEVEVPAADVEGEWNEGALARIVENLLENAIKFTDPGGEVAVRVHADAATATLEVEDTGIGMEPEQVPGLFQPFKQESEGLMREYEGAGLGLSIVKRLTEVHGGTVDVETAKGEGTCFTVRLPRVASRALR